MTVRELIEQLSRLPAELPVWVGQSPAHDQVVLDDVYDMDTDERYVLLAGAFEDD